MLGKGPLIARQALQVGKTAPRALTSSRSAPSQSRLVLSFAKNAIKQQNKPTERLGVAAFHSSAKRQLLPPLPQKIDGTTNDAAPIPPAHPTHGSYHWGFERALSIGLVPLTIAPFAAGTLNPVMDSIFCATILIHSHIGFQSIIIDYLPRKRVPKSRALLMWGLNAGTLLVGVGLYEFETNDVGVTEAIKRIWMA